MRFPLALKVTLWLLLNLLLLAGLACFVLFRGENGFTWNTLLLGPAGRGVQAWAELTVNDLHTRPRSQWDERLARAGEIRDVDLALYVEGARQVAGLTDAPPPRLREWMRVRPRPARSGPPPLGDFDDDSPPPPSAAPPPRLANRLLVHAAEPAAYWIGLQLGGPGRPREFLVIRMPKLATLLDVLELTSLLWIALGAVVFSILFWLPFVGGLTGALGRLTRATEAIADGRFDTRVPEARRDELGALGGSINRMSGRLERLVDGQKRFLGDIAHELGSPLGRMQMGVGILEERAPAALQPAVADVREEVAHMAGLVAELLAFTRAGLLPRPAARVRVELAPLIARVLAREAAFDAVTVDVAEDLAVSGDADLLARALGNLVRNALRYAGRGVAITVRARRVGEERVELVVEDAGPGVTAEALARLGEPFFRPETARARETGGAGLGLAIVRACAEACGGSLHFAAVEPQGLRATLRLLVAPAQ
jgi:two-component system sensor histidine kinase CpxA